MLDLGNGGIQEVYSPNVKNGRMVIKELAGLGRNCTGNVGPC